MAVADRHPIGITSRDLPTATLVERARGGDAGAQAALFRRFYPRLRRWAHGRLPSGRRPIDTDDLVQVSLARALSHLESFELRREGAFLAYLRRILLNYLRDELRRGRRNPHQVELHERIVDRSASPVETAIGQEALERYERALAGLGTEQREAIILRVEMGYTFQELADVMGRPSANAARLLVLRALMRLAKAMRVE